MRKLSLILTIVAIFTFHLSNAQNWINETIASFGAGKSIGLYCYLAIGSDNVMHISHYDGNNHHLLYTTNESGQWVTEIVDSTGRVGEYCSIAVDTLNIPHIAYFEWLRNDSIPYDTTILAFPYGNLKYATKVGGLWQTMVIDSVSGLTPRICTDNLNNVHIVHTKSGFDSTDISNVANTKYTTNSSGTWESVNIADTIVKGADASIVADNNNKVHIAVHNQEGAGTSATGPMGGLRYITNLSGTWMWYNIDTVKTAGNDTQIALDNDNNIHISYLDKDLGLKYASNKTGNWQTVVVDTNINVGWNSSIAVDANDKVHISYSDPIFLIDPPGNGYLKYAFEENGIWDYMIIDSVNAGMFTFLALDTMELPHIVYTVVDTIIGSGILRHAFIDTTSLSLNEKYFDRISLIIYPNPFTLWTVLETNYSLNNAILTVYNIYGQEVRRISNIFGHTMILHRDNLPGGLYFICLTENGRVISTDRFIIID